MLTDTVYWVCSALIDLYIFVEDSININWSTGFQIKYWPFSGTGSVDFIGNLSSEVCLYRVFINAVHCSKSLRPSLKWLWSNFNLTVNLLTCKEFKTGYLTVSGLPIWKQKITIIDFILVSTKNIKSTTKNNFYVWFMDKQTFRS